MNDSASERISYVAASANYLKKQGEPRHLADLKAHNCLLGTQDYRRFTENGRDRNIKVACMLRCNSGMALLDAALKDIGLVQLSNYFLQSHIDSGRLVKILEPFRKSEEIIWAVSPQNRFVLPKIRILIDYLAEH